MLACQEQQTSHGSSLDKQSAAVPLPLLSGRMWAAWCMAGGQTVPAVGPRGAASTLRM